MTVVMVGDALWLPALAGMTVGDSLWLPVFAGMTATGNGIALIHIQAVIPAKARS